MKRLFLSAAFLAACTGGSSGGRTACTHVLSLRDSVSSDWGAEADDSNVLEGGACADAGDDALGGVTITAQGSTRTVVATTDRSGHYILRDVPAGSVRVTARRDGYASEERLVAFGGCGSIGPAGTKVDVDRTTCRHRQWVAFHLHKST